MPKSFMEDWFWGPHDPKARSAVGALSWAVVHSTYWEYLFLMYILFNAVLKLTYRRIQSEDYREFLADVGLYACIIFNLEWLFELLTFGYNEFFEDNWYKSDTVVNLMNWGSYLSDISVLTNPIAYFFPNIAFLRMLRFLKPLGRVKLFFPSKVVVKTVSASLQSMGPVLSLVFFAMFFFGVAGIYIFGNSGALNYRCGVALEPEDAFAYYDPSDYEYTADGDMQVQNCTVDMDRYHEFVKLRGERTLGSLVAPVQVQPSVINSSQFVETMANFSNFSILRSARHALQQESKRNVLSISETRKAQRRVIQVLAQIPRKEEPADGSCEIRDLYDRCATGAVIENEYEPKPVTLDIRFSKMVDCPDTMSFTPVQKEGEIFVVNGMEMGMGQFVTSEEFSGRYLWLSKEIPTGEHSRRRQAAAESDINKLEHNKPFGNYRKARCIVVQPARICKCAGTDTISNEVCIDPRCPRSLCFLSEMSPISKLHGFSNIIQAALTVTAIFFQKNWSLWMEKCAEVDPLMAYVYYLMTVILGSFCLLNLTVATVGQNYTRVKKEAEAKKAIKEAEAAARAKIQAERDEMKKMQMANKNDDDDDDDDDDDVIIVFDTGTAYWYWLLGLVGLPFMHRVYFKLYDVDAPPGLGKKAIVTWYFPFKSSVFWFGIRCITLNYFIVGWILDGLAMSALNTFASEEEAERTENYLTTTNENFKNEIDRLRHEKVMDDNPLMVMIGKFLLYPIDDPDDFPWSNAREFLEADYEQFQKENKDWCEKNGTDYWDKINNEQPQAAGGDATSQAGLDEASDDDSEGSEDLGPQTNSGPMEKPSQSHFAWFADFVVFANATTLALEGVDDSLQIYLDAVGYFASLFFIIEAIVKSYAYGGFSYYIKDGSNLFDFVLVIVPSLGEGTTIFTDFVLGQGDDLVYPALAIQSLRVFRITKLTKHLTGLKRLTAQAFGSPVGVAYALAVTIVFIVFCTMFGNDLFRDSVVFAQRRNDFQYFFEALKAMLEFLFGENYFLNLEVGLDVANVIGLLFFVCFFYIANYLVLRMFIALILENFEFDQDKRISLQIQLFQKRQIQANDLIDGNARDIPIADQYERLKKQNLDPDLLESFQRTWEQIVRNRAAESGNTGAASVVKNLWDVIIEANKEIESYGAANEPSRISKILTNINVTVRTAVYDLIEWQFFNLFVASCIIFSVVLLQVDTPAHPILDPDIRGLIDFSLLGFFTMEMFVKMYAFGMYVQPQPVRKTTEHPGGMPPFFSNTEEGGWNMIDFVFICVSYLDVGGVDIGNFKTIRIVRVVRPLQKNIRTVKGLIAALLASIGNIFHVLNLLLLLMIIWGLMGVSLFRGRFHKCNDLAAANFQGCIGTSYGGLPAVPCDFMNPNFPNGTDCPNDIGVFLEQPILVPRVWEPPRENFENMGSAFMFLFRLLCADTLRPAFHALMDVPASRETICSSGGDGSAGCPPGEYQYLVADQPRKDSKPENMLFAVVFMFFANCFITQLVIGVLIDNIRQQSGTALFTEVQRAWYSTGRTIANFLKLPLRPTKPADEVFSVCGYVVTLYGREFLYEILWSDFYDKLMNVIIIVNTVWMATEHWPAEPWYHTMKNIIDVIFVYIYLIETIAKIYSFGVIGWTIDTDAGAAPRPGDNVLLKKLGIKNVKSPYFGDPWCMFDFIVVGLSVVTTFSTAGKALEPLKLLRVLRVFRLVKKVKTLQIMISTLVGAIPSILSALFFLAIWIFLFASIGMQFFSTLKDGEVISQAWNFRTIMSSMILLFRVATGDGWFPIIYDASISAPYCTSFNVDLATIFREKGVLNVENVTNNSSFSGNLTCQAPKMDEKGESWVTVSDCGSGVVAYVYFLLFWFGCNFMFLPLFVATLIDYFSESQINETSLFNDEECERFQEAWKEFDDTLSGKISMENLRPLIERLCDKGSRVGFRVGAERDRYKQVWARIMTDPINFGNRPLSPPEDLVEEWGFEKGFKIDRETILKAFPNNNRSKSIKSYIYDHTKIREREEVRFEYCAKVLLIFQNGIKAPITSTDLVKQGASLQQFMGFLGMDEVKGRDGAEALRWNALGVHHELVQKLADGPKKQKRKRQAADVSQLSRINLAVDYVKLELKPPPPRRIGDDPTPKPSGDKRAQLIDKIDTLQSSFDKLISSALEDLLYGSEPSPGKYRPGILDVLLDRIIQDEVHKFAVKSVASIQKRFAQGQAAKNFSKQKRFSIKILEQKSYEPVVTTVPRGWLTSHRKSKPKRLVLSSEIQDEVEDQTLNTLNVLSKKAPSRPKRVDSAQMQQMSCRLAGPNDPRSEQFKNRMRDQNQNQIWRQMFYNTNFEGKDQPPEAPTESEGYIKTVFSWRDQYSTAIETVAQRISENRPKLPPVSVPKHEIFNPMDQIMEIGSLIGMIPKRSDEPKSAPEVSAKEESVPEE